MFDRIVLINLDKRKDRLGAFQAKLIQCPSLRDYTRYRAVHGDTVTVPPHFISGGGAWGCKQSHLRVLEDAMLDGVQTLLVLEDDVRFTPEFEEKFQAFMRAVPDDWDGLMLGGQDHDPGPMPTGIDGVVRSRNTQRTHAYVIRGLAPMQALYRLWTRCDRHIDHWFSQWQQQHIVYQPQPWLCGQDESNSDISGRQDSVRYWQHTTPDIKNVPLTLLVSERAVAESLRNLGFHYGNDRDLLTGRDNGFTRLESGGWPANDLKKWADLIVYEATERNAIPGIWHTPTPEVGMLQTRTQRDVRVVEAKTVEIAVGLMPQLLPAWNASRIIWCLRGGGYELLEGLAFHGWHRGYWRDDITGLDQGTRQAVDQDKYTLFKILVRQLLKEVVKIRCGKVLIAHPRLDVQRLREELPHYKIVELIGGSVVDMLNQAIVESL